MSKIYIVLTYTGTVLSNLVKVYTRKEYSHVSISLDEKLNHMYSFGRRYAYCPFFGGFVQESPKFGTFKRFRKTKTKIYSLEVDERQYEQIRRLIKEFDLDKEKYKFNLIGLFAVAFHLRVKRERHFYCAEFVKYVLDNSDIEINLPDIIKPNDFEKIDGISEIYTGSLNEYIN
jgi:hypothetical protein